MTDANFGWNFVNTSPRYT